VATPFAQRGHFEGRAERPIRVMIVDDSLVARTFIARMLEGRPEFEVVGSAADAETAMRLLATLRPDSVLLDVEMPGTDGLTALPELIGRAQGAHVVIVSSGAAEGGAQAVRALALGAADTLLKPAAGDFAGRFAQTLAERLLRLGHARQAGARDSDQVGEAASPVAGQPGGGAIECIAIGASTGGMTALSAFFGRLPPTISAPILVTQHLPATFMPFFAAQLEETTGRPTSVATAGARLMRGAILVAPGDGHLRVERTPACVKVRLDRGAVSSGCLPSVDPMFESMARTYGPRGLGVVLSGMGRDGLIGAGAIVAAGGEVLVQDQQSSVVWGMPGSIANAGLAAAVLPPSLIAQRIGGRAERGSWR
jgi:two-component system, chemotaxis family, protein-glutamate methylesterase/glutaminase